MRSARQGATRTARRWGRDEGGFTLPELILVIVLMGIVITPLVESFIDAFRSTADVSTNIATSHDRQAVGIYLDRDIASAETGAINGPGACATLFGQAQPAFLTLSWPSGGAGNYEVDYVIVGAQLWRYYCLSTTELNAQRLSSSISTTYTGTQAPSVQFCNPSCQSTPVYYTGTSTSPTAIGEGTEAGTTITVTFPDTLGSYAFAGTERSYG